ncbi:MAG: FAD-binding domain-containing protein, partial [Coleofasciculaceae cyanobacterium]
ELPEDVANATTGMVCIDSFSHDLQAIGYLHNHGRMWMAAYLVHWRQVDWKAGARWFLEHLLDGDPASNNLSWQWVASTFSHKPYFFNRENLQKYTEGVYCQACPLYGKCDFEGSYEQIEQKLFPKAESLDRSGGSKSFQRPAKKRR